MNLVYLPTIVMRPDRRQWIQAGGLLCVAGAMCAFACSPGRATERHTTTDLASVERMPADQKQQLALRQLRFSRLDLDAQLRLRKLHADLSGHPREQNLRRVLERYHDWLEELTIEQRASLDSLSSADKIARIKELQVQQQRRKQQEQIKLSAPDQQTIETWMRKTVASRRTELIAQLPKERREYVEQLPNDRLAMYMAWRMRSDSGAGRRWLTQSDATELVRKLSPDAQQKLASLPDDEARQRQLRIWIRHALIPSGSFAAPGFRGESGRGSRRWFARPGAEKSSSRRAAESNQDKIKATP